MGEPHSLRAPAAMIGIGASAGGVEALSALVSLLPPDLPAAVLIVLHVSPAGTSVLPQLLNRRSPLTVSQARDGEPLLAGRVYVAPPDRHLLVDEHGTARVNREARENGHRPAVDPTLRSLARAYGPAAIGVILSGTRDDGTVGLAQVHAAGGATLVQDPEECLYDGMPRNALRATPSAEVLPLKQLGPRLGQLAAGLASSVPAAEGAAVTDLPLTYAVGAVEPGDRLPTRFVCPDCGGVMFDEPHGGTETLVCSVGHIYGPESFVDEQGRELESALWAAVRSLEDRAVLLRRLAERTGRHGRSLSAGSFEADAIDLEQRAALIREVITRPPTLDVANGDAAA